MATRKKKSLHRHVALGPDLDLLLADVSRYTSGRRVKSSGGGKKRKGKHYVASRLSQMLAEIKPHRKLTAKCKWCGKRHSASQHASHGHGSFDKTHPGYVYEREQEEND